jgi:hypothetical protein
MKRQPVFVFIDVYFLDTTGLKGCMRKSHGATWTTIKIEARRWRVSVETIQASSVVGTPIKRHENENPARISMDIPMTRIPKHGRNAFKQ